MILLFIWWIVGIVGLFCVWRKEIDIKVYHLIIIPLVGVGLGPIVLLWLVPWRHFNKVLWVKKNV